VGEVGESVSESRSDSGFLVLRPDVAVAVLGDGAVMLDLETKYFFSVNSTGWAILRMFERGTTLERVRAQCRAWSGGDGTGGLVEAFMQTLLRERLVAESGTGRSQDLESTLEGGWSTPTIEKHSKPLQRIMTSAFDPSIPLAE
jgi:hypothetical protein